VHTAPGRPLFIRFTNESIQANSLTFKKLLHRKAEQLGLDIADELAWDPTRTYNASKPLMNHPVIYIDGFVEHCRKKKAYKHSNIENFSLDEIWDALKTFKKWIKNDGTNPQASQVGRP
jgi:hypothetical protein